MACHGWFVARSGSLRGSETHQTVAWQLAAAHAAERPLSSWDLQRLFLGQMPGFQKDFFELGADRLDLDPANDVIGKGEDQQVACCLEVQAPRPEIEQRLVLKLTDGCPVRALDVVGIDLQLRLGADYG